jgi:Flp pilus assembly protein TadG
VIRTFAGQGGAPKRRQSGQAVAETAIAIPILLLVFFFLIETAAFAFTLMTVEHATQDGGRLAALPDTATETAVKDYVRSRAAIAPVTIDDADVTITITCPSSPCTFATRATGDRVRVVVSYSYSPLIAMVFGTGTTFTLGAQTEYHVE